MPKSPLSEFLHRQNVDNFKRRLLLTPSADCRAILEELLANEAASAKRNGWLRR